MIIFSLISYTHLEGGKAVKVRLHTIVDLMDLIFAFFFRHVFLQSYHHSNIYTLATWLMILKVHFIFCLSMKWNVTILEI